MNSNVIFRSIVVAMFTIILAMAGYIVANINKSTDTSIMSLQGQMDSNVHRLDRTIDRVNDMDQRLAASEARIVDLQMRR